MRDLSGPVAPRLTLTRGLIGSAVVLALMFLAQPAHAATFTGFDSSASQVISGSSPTETGRPFRGGTASTCGAPNFPSTLEGTIAHHYNPYLHTSDLNNSVCVQVTLSTACAGSTSIFAQSYDPSFDPANITTNYVGDMGSSPPAATSYSFTVGAGHTFIDVVSEVTANGGCPSYGIAWGSDLPWNSGSPTLSGSPTNGQALTTSSGTWNASPALAYQWRRCSAAGTSCSDIAGATSGSYTLTAADIGHTVRARVLATNAEGTSSTDTAASAVVLPAFTAFDSATAQVISGASPTETGRPLRNGVASTCGAPNVPGTFGGTTAFHYNPYTHTSDLNNSVCVQVTLSTACAGSTSIFAQSYDPSFDPANITTNYVGDMGSSPPAAASYSLTVGAGHTFIDVVNEVTANAGCPVYGIAWGSDLPWNSGSPTLSGTPTSGQSLTTSSGTWNASPALAYQWRRCSAAGTSCSDIAGATSGSYTLTAADVGQTLRARVLATNAEGTSSTDTAASAVVAAAPPTTPPAATTATSPTAPRITGVSQSAGKWRAGKALAQLTRSGKPPIGTTFKFSLDQAATVRFTFTALSVGRRVGKRCARRTKSNAHKPRCTLRQAVGTLSLRAHPGADKVRFQGRISSVKKLKPGRYTVAITATNATGQQSSARTLSFTIVR